MMRFDALRNDFWHLLCHRTELPEPGSYIKFNWLDDEVVVFNDRGNLVVFDNLCPHRGTRFFLENHGTGALSCSYHGWAYHGGRMHIPCLEQYSESVLSRATLNVLKVEWCADFLFAAISPRYSLEEQLGSMYDRLATISFNIHGRTDFNAYTFDCDWRIAIENALEPLHIPYVHSGSLGQLNLDDGRNEFDMRNAIWYARVRNPRMVKQLEAIKSLFRIEDQFEGYMSLYLFPFTMISSTYGYSYSLQNFFPHAEENKAFFSSRLLNGVVKSASASSALKNFFQSSAEMNRRVFEEDHEICKRVSPNFNPRGVAILAATEEKIAHFRKSISTATTASE